MWKVLKRIPWHELDPPNERSMEMEKKIQYSKQGFGTDMERLIKTGMEK